MRYLIRVRNPDHYTEIADLVRQEATVLVEIPRRQALSADNISPQLFAKVERLGGTLEPELQFAPEVIAPY